MSIKCQQYKLQYVWEYIKKNQLLFIPEVVSMVRLLYHTVQYLRENNENRIIEENTTQT